MAFLLNWVLLTIILVRRRHTAAASDNQAPLESWYLSGIGQELAWDGRAPPPGYDARNKDDGMVGDYVVAYTNQYDTLSLESWINTAG